MVVQIKVDLNVLLALADVLDQQKSLNDLTGIFRSVQSQLDLEISSPSNIMAMLEGVQQRNKGQEERLRNLSGSLRQGADGFTACDKHLAQQQDQILDAAAWSGIIPSFQHSADLLVQTGAFSAMTSPFWPDAP